jgi:F0F1-type ATP synthase membrane subunit b/b'
LKECKYYAVPYLDKRLVQLEKDEFIKTGIIYISNLKKEPQQLKNELKLELKKADYIVSKIQHPNYIELRELLIKIKGGTKEYRQNILKLAYELLELYCQINVENN